MQNASCDGYLGFTNKERHEDCSDAFLEYDGKDDAASHIDQHHAHPHTPAATHKAYPTNSDIAEDPMGMDRQLLHPDGCTDY